MKFVLAICFGVFATATFSQQPTFVSEVIFDYAMRFEILEEGQVVMPSGHLDGLSFFERCYRMDWTSEGAEIAWAWNESDASHGFSTDAVPLSNGHVVLFTPEDVSFTNAHINLRLTCLSAEGDLIWQHAYLQELNSTVNFQNLRLLPTPSGGIVAVVPVPAGNDVAYERWEWDEDGNLMSQAPTGLIASDGVHYDFEAHAMLPDGTLVLAGRWDLVSDVILAIGTDGSVLWEDQFAPAEGLIWFSDALVTGNGDVVFTGYLALDGNRGMVTRIGGDGTNRTTTYYGTVEESVLFQSIVALDNGRVAIGGRWMNEEGVRAPRVMIWDADISQEEFHYSFPSEVSGAVECLRLYNGSSLLGINNLVLSSTERMDFWSMEDVVLLSTDKWQVNRWTIGPNPFRDVLALNGPLGGSYVLTTTSGERMMAGPLVPSLDLTEFPSGAYLLHLHDDDRSETVRIVKQ